MKTHKFMVESETLEKLRNEMNKAAKVIESAINEKRPVWIRHHADCDGYCGAVALERVILKKISMVIRRESDIYYYYRRYPSRTPFYDYTDALKDISNMLSEINRHEQKMPLIVVIDNGSSREDALALKRLKIYGAQIVVIDHHPLGEENDEFIDVHINPLIKNADPYVTAGIISAELAYMIDSTQKDLELLAALAGVGDKAENKELEEYLALAAKKGYNKEDLMVISEVFDFEAYHIGYLESRYLIDGFLFADREKQKKAVEILGEEIRKRKENITKAIAKYIKFEEQNGIIISILDVDSITQAGEYPLRGKTTSIAQKYAEDNNNKPVIMLSYGKTFITFRISKEVNIDMNKISRHLEEKFPYALIQGGGHPRAGTIRFNSASGNELLDETIKYIKKEIKT